MRTVNPFRLKSWLAGLTLPALALPALTFSAATLASSQAQATIVERIVAIVGERPVLLSELRTRTRPFLRTLPGSSSERAAAQSKLYTEMLERIVDEELMRRAAARAKIDVSREEVNAAIQRVAQGNDVAVPELMEELERSGVSPSQYRRELRRQLLDAKVMNLRLQGRIRVSKDDLSREYQELVQTERRQLDTRAAAIRIAIPSNVDGQERAKLRARAVRAAQDARAGKDFAELGQATVDATPQGSSSGLLPSVKPTDMPAELAAAVLKMEVGDVSAPIRSGGAFVVLKLIERGESQLPAFEAALPQLQQRVQMKKMEKARRNWLKSLRRRTHVQIRL